MAGAPPAVPEISQLGYLVGCEKPRLLAGDSYVGAVERFVLFGEAIEFGRVHPSLSSVRSTILRSSQSPTKHSLPARCQGGPERPLRR